MSWTPLADDTALRLWAEGKSASEIAGELWEALHMRTTRNAVIGRLNRLKAPKRSVLQTQTRLERRRATERQRKFVAPRRPIKVKPMPETKPAAPEPESRNVSLAMLNSFECHWVTDTTPYEQRYCGHTVALGSNYCPHHEARARQPKGKAR